MIIYSVTKVFELDTRMDGAIGLMNGVLVHDDNAGTML
jgi:hypothetical protein